MEMQRPSELPRKLPIPDSCYGRLAFDEKFLDGDS